MNNTIRHAQNSSLYTIFAVLFVSFLLLSNIGATKMIGLGPLVFDGGAILFPLTYVLGDVLSEVYGFANARRVIVLGFVVSIIASIVFWLIIVAPAHSSYMYQEEFKTVLGVVPRFVAASLVGYVFGQLLNSWVLVKIKERWGERHLWARLIGSTAVGEFVDTTLFCLIAWLGVSSLGIIANLIVVGYAYKVLLEVLLLPVTYIVIGWVKKVELR